MRLKLIILALLVAASAAIYANDKQVSSHDLASRVQQQLMTVAPNAIVVVVDEKNQTAYVRGSANHQQDVATITEALRNFDGVRVVGSNLAINTETTSTTEVDRNSLDHTAAINQNTSQSDVADDSTAMVQEDNSAITDEQEDTTVLSVPEAAGTQTPGPYGEGVAEETVAPDDATLKEAVIEALKSEGIMGQSKIRVDTEGGVVTLTGTALSEAQADRIVELARSVPGVVGINPNLQLRDEKRPYKVKPSPDVDKNGHPVDDND